MTPFTTLQLERIDRVLRVTIAHPSSPLNAVDEALHQDLTALFADLRRENEARAVRDGDRWQTAEFLLDGERV